MKRDTEENSKLVRKERQGENIEEEERMVERKKRE